MVAKKLNSIDISDSASSAYHVGQIIEITEDDYAIYLWGATITCETASVSTMSLDEETTETEKVEAVEEEKSNEEVSIYSEVNIYSEK